MQCKQDRDPGNTNILERTSKRVNVIENESTVIPKSECIYNEQAHKYTRIFGRTTSLISFVVLKHINVQTGVVSTMRNIAQTVKKSLVTNMIISIRT
jgi:hypothetical protein